MESTRKNKPDIEQQKFDFEREKFELEKEKFEHARKHDQQKLESDRTTKLWTQVSIFTPLVIVIIGFFLNAFYEQYKLDKVRYYEQNQRERLQKKEDYKAKRQFIVKQLEEFYYPLDFRLFKNHALFEFQNKNKNNPSNKNLTDKIERDYMPSNHDEIIKIIDTHYHLFKNDSDIDEELKPLAKALLDYQRHVATYKALIESKDPRKTIDVAEAFPKGFFELVNKRVTSLEYKRDELERKINALEP
jgi:hypothetical protein